MLYLTIVAGFSKTIVIITGCMHLRCKKPKCYPFSKKMHTRDMMMNEYPFFLVEIICILASKTSYLRISSVADWIEMENRKRGDIWQRSIYLRQ
uniref:Csu622 n=1 Tax=Arundo donax TaxID=35708 RepID=A0A0A9DM33_ARUDO